MLIEEVLWNVQNVSNESRDSLKHGEKSRLQIQLFTIDHPHSIGAEYYS